MNIDYKSKNYWVNRLSNKGFEVVDTDNTIGTTARWDLEATKDGFTYYIELKDRNVYSTTYSDNSIQKDKYEAIMTECSKGLHRLGVTISMFKDGIFFMNLINDEHKESQRYAPKTTSFANRDMVLKNFVDYKPRWKGEYKYE